MGWLPSRNRNTSLSLGSPVLQSRFKNQSRPETVRRQFSRVQPSNFLSEGRKLQPWPGMLSPMRRRVLRPLGRRKGFIISSPWMSEHHPDHWDIMIGYNWVTPSKFSIGNTCSNCGFSIVMLVFWVVNGYTNWVKEATYKYRGINWGNPNH